MSRLFADRPIVDWTVTWLTNESDESSMLNPCIFMVERDWGKIHQSKTRKENIMMRCDEVTDHRSLTFDVASTKQIKTRTRTNTKTIYDGNNNNHQYPIHFLGVTYQKENPLMMVIPRSIFITALGGILFLVAVGEPVSAFPTTSTSTSTSTANGRCVSSLVKTSMTDRQWLFSKTVQSGAVRCHSTQQPVQLQQLVGRRKLQSVSPSVQRSISSPTTTSLCMWSQDDEIKGANRYRSCVPYLLPLLDGEMFGKYIYERIPPLGFLDSLFVGPLYEIFRQIPFIGLILFVALTLGTRGNTDMDRNVRFNAQQAALIDVLLVIPELISASLEDETIPRYVSEPCMNFVWYTYMSMVLYSIYSNLKGRKPDKIPYISVYADLIVGPL